MEHEDLLPCSQDSAIAHYPIYTDIPHFLKIHLYIIL